MRQATKQTINNNLCLVTFKEPPAWKGKPSNTWVVLALPAVVVHGRHSSARISKQDVRSDRSIPPPPPPPPSLADPSNLPPGVGSGDGEAEYGGEHRRGHGTRGERAALPPPHAGVAGRRRRLASATCNKHRTNT